MIRNSLSHAKRVKQDEISIEILTTKEHTTGSNFMFLSFVNFVPSW
jgi:hypothetical protein